MSDNLEILWDSAFANNSIKGIESLNGPHDGGYLPKNLKIIGAMAFYNNAFTMITVPDNVIKIGLGVFSFNWIDRNKVSVPEKLLNSICDWNGKTVRENFDRIFIDKM